MLKKRVIFTLLFENNFFWLSRNFRLQRVGNIDWLQKNYNFSKIAFSIDELIILDVSRDHHDDENFRKHVRLLTEGCFVPIAAGGGIRSVEQAHNLLRSGADKIVINSLLDIDPGIVREIASEFGRQCVVASVDVKLCDGAICIFTENGSTPKILNLSEYLEKIISLPIGELYLNSMDKDGTGQGYNMPMLDELPDPMPIPVILAGGAGNYSHLALGLADERVDAVATANLYNFVGDGLSKARHELINHGFSLPIWNDASAILLKNKFANDFGK